MINSGDKVAYVNMTCKPRHLKLAGPPALCVIDLKNAIPVCLFKFNVIYSDEGLGLSERSIELWCVSAYSVRRQAREGHIIEQRHAANLANGTEHI